MQVEPGIIRQLCEMAGQLRLFQATPAGDAVLVQYLQADDAMKAHRMFSGGIPGSLPPLVCELVSEAEAMQVGGGQAGHSLLSGAVGTGSAWSSGLGGSGFGAAGVGGGVWGSGGGGLMDDHSSSYLPSDLFGGP